MRKRTSLLLLGLVGLTISLSDCSGTKATDAPNDDDTDVKTQGLFGKVKSVKTYGAFVAADGRVNATSAKKTIGYRFESFNAKGQCTEEAEYSAPDSLNYRVTTEYDGSGRKTYMTYASRWEKSVTKCACFYLPDGKVGEEYAYGFDYENDAESCIFQKVVYEYDQKGNPILRSHYRIGEYGVPRFKYVFTYGDGRQPTEECRCDAEGVLREKIVNTYDGVGRLVARLCSQGAFSYTERYTYDENGRLAEIVGEMDGDRTTCKYDGKGAIVKRTSRYGDNFYEYECDRHGNWVRQAVYEEPGHKLSHVVEREIAYYE